MSSIPAYQAATTGQPGNAGSVNQFLGAHTATVVWQGSQQAHQATSGGISVNTFGQSLAQSFATTSAQTTIGYIIAPIATATSTGGSSLGPTTLSLYADNGTGAPNGNPLVSTTLTSEYLYAVTGGTLANSSLTILPVTGLTPSTNYWLVLAAAGTSGNHYNWYKSNQVSGASTSPDGVTWTAQGYGFQYQIFDQVPTNTNLLAGTWGDGGNRWTAFVAYTSVNLPSYYAEYTAGQTTAGYLQSTRALTYTSGLLTGVA